MSAAEAGDQFAENAIVAYVTYAADQPHAVEVGGDDKHYLDSWLSKRIGMKLVAPDLAAEGFTLLGGRILPAGHDVAALLVYKDAASNQLSIYVTGAGTGQGEGHLCGRGRRPDRHLLARSSLRLRDRRFASAGSARGGGAKRLEPDEGKRGKLARAAIANAAYRQLLDRSAT